MRQVVGHRCPARRRRPRLRRRGSLSAGAGKRDLNYVVGISTTTTAHPETARPHNPPYDGRGPRPRPICPGLAQTAKKPVIAVCNQAARPVQWSEAHVLAVRGPADPLPADALSAEQPTAPTCRCTGCWPNGPPTSPTRPVPALFLHPPAHHPDSKRDGAGSNPYQVARELQLLLTVWTGACPTCHAACQSRYQPGQK
ncbi:transposase [Streptomyces achromogenes]|uniref:transposase n=1 Tax=Streptomyces achromogenes TaxID=67255 RepID=UPI003717D763